MLVVPFSNETKCGDGRASAVHTVVLPCNSLREFAQYREARLAAIIFGTRPAPKRVVRIKDFHHCYEQFPSSSLARWEPHPIAHVYGIGFGRAVASQAVLHVPEEAAVAPTTHCLAVVPNPCDLVLRRAMGVAGMDPKGVAGRPGYLPGPRHSPRGPRRRAGLSKSCGDSENRDGHTSEM